LRQNQGRWRWHHVQADIQGKVRRDDGAATQPATWTDTTPPNQSIGADGSMNASGGGGITDIKASMGGSGKGWLILAGLLGCGAGGWFLYRRNMRAAIVSFGVGGSLIGLAFLPTWILGVGALAVIAAWLYSEYSGKRTYEALNAVVSGVASAPAQVRDAVKAKIAEQADEADSEVIRKLQSEKKLDVIEAKS
jgi:hypothetical protein